MRGKTSFLLAITFLAVSWAMLPANALAQVRFGIDFRFNPQFVLPIAAALEEGLWKKQGLEVKYLTFDGSAGMNLAAAAGAIEMGGQGLNSIINGVAAGVPVIAVADPGISTEFYFWVRADSKLREPRDLKGAKIGVTRFGDEAHAYAVAAARSLGLEKDVKMVSMGGGPPQIAGLRAGSLDISSLSFFTMATLIARGEVRALLRVNDYLPKGFYHLHMILSTVPFAQKSPELAKRAVKGYLQGVEFVLKNKSWAVEKMKAEFGYPEAAAQAAYDMLGFKPQGKIDPARVKSAMSFLVENGLLDKGKVPPLEKVYLEGYAPL